MVLPLQVDFYEPLLLPKFDPALFVEKEKKTKAPPMTSCCHPAPSTGESQFTRQTQLRTYRLVTKERVFFVNPYYLAELSPYFHQLCFNRGFIEGQENKTELTEDADEVELFLEAVCASQSGDRREVNEHNCAVLINLADQWDVPSLMRRCEKFLVEVLPLRTPCLHCCASMLCAVGQHGVKKGVSNLLGRLAYFGLDALVRENVAESLCHPRLVAALFASAASPDQPSLLAEHAWNHAETAERSCSIMGCCDEAPYACGQCGFAFCSQHKLAIRCPRPPTTLFTPSTMPCGKRVEDPAIRSIKLVAYREGCKSVDPKLIGKL